jgi:hypothetical protein
MDKLKEFQQLTKITNRSGISRCSICNCVSNESIETEIGDYRAHMSFTQDPKYRDSVICISCSEVIQEQLDEWSYLDEDNGDD